MEDINNIKNSDKIPILYRLLMIFGLILSINSQIIGVPKIIFDSDIAKVDEQGKDNSDIDDLGALAILNALASKGKCEILCIVTNSRSDKVVEMIDAVNNFYGHPDIPIGIKHGKEALTEDRNSYSTIITEQFRHTQYTISASTSTEVLREVLAKISVKDTVIYIHADAISNWEHLSIGPFLRSVPDKITHLTGWELFNEKVDRFVTYIPCLPNNEISNNCPIWGDVASSDTTKLRYFIERYQHELIGNSTAVEEVHLPTKLWEQDRGHPIKIAYEHYYTQTPPPWHLTNELPQEISLYGDGLGIFFSVMGGIYDQLLNQIKLGQYVLDDENKLRWKSTINSDNHSYFYTKTNQQSILWEILDGLICYQPTQKSMK